MTSGAVRHQPIVRFCFPLKIIINDLNHFVEPKCFFYVFFFFLRTRLNPFFWIFLFGACETFKPQISLTCAIQQVSIEIPYFSFIFFSTKKRNTLEPCPSCEYSRTFTRPSYVIFPELYKLYAVTPRKGHASSPLGITFAFWDGSYVFKYSYKFSYPSRFSSLAIFDNHTFTSSLYLSQYFTFEIKIL